MNIRNHLSMWQFQLKASLRRIFRSKLTYIINTTCMAAGITSFLIVSLYVYQELGFNHHYDQGAQIYRVASSLTSIQTRDTQKMGPVIASLHHHLQDYPGIDQLTSVVRENKAVNIEHNGRVFNERNILRADQSFFKVFNQAWSEGEPKSALENPNSIVITSSFAKKYFGHSKDVLGKDLILNEDVYLVTGVVDDTPENSDLHFDAIVSFESDRADMQYDWSQLFLILNTTISPESFQEHLTSIFNLEYKPILAQSGIDGTFELEKLYDIHFGEERILDGPKADKAQLILLTGISLIVLLVAIINYIILILSDLPNQTRGLGVKKIFGATKNSLLYNYLFELLFLIIISLSLAFLTIFVLRPELEQLIGYRLPISISDLLIVSAVIVLVVTAISTCCFYALIIYKFNALQALKGSLNSGKKLAPAWRISLLSFQLTSCLIFTAGGLIVSNQMTILTEVHPKFDREGMVVIELPEDEMADMYIQDLNSLAAITGVSRVGNEALPMSEDKLWDVYRAKRGNEDITKLCSVIHVDTAYLNLLQIDIHQGINFVDINQEAGSRRVIINNALAASLDWENPVGQKIYYVNTEYEVAGVVEDFNDNGLQAIVHPLIIFRLDEDPSNLIIKINEFDDEKLASLKELWSRHFGPIPFEYELLNSRFLEQFRKESLLQSATIFFALLTMLIGVFGLIAFISSDIYARARELAIRKILGAERINLLGVTVREYLISLIIGGSLSAVVVTYFSREWLQNFSERATIDFTYFIMPFLGLGTVACFILWFKIVKVEKRNATYYLRYE